MSEETNTNDGPAFELRDGKFYRLEDKKEIAHLVCAKHPEAKPTIEGLHHTQEKYREELEKLISPEPDPAGVTAYKGENPPQPLTDEEAKDLNAREVTAKSKEQNKATSEAIAEAVDAPRALFDKSLGDRTPEVIDWRRDNWSLEKFAAKYPNL